MAKLEGLTAGTWNIDASHTNVEFVVRHLMVSKVRGRFTDVSGTITVADDPLQSSVNATIQVLSVNTGDDNRDNHLRTNDFFAAEQFPTITFASGVIKQDGDDYVLAGDLTIRGVTRQVELELEFNGVAKDPWGGTRAGFSAEGEVSRKDFGVEWNAPLEAGGVVIGDKVKLQLEIEAVKA